MIDNRGIPLPGKRYKNAIAVADGYRVYCPYKGCGNIISLDHASKGEIIQCKNCRKEIKIRKVE